MEKLVTISPAAVTSRRKWLFRAGMALNAVAATLVGVPILGYVLSGLFGRKTNSAWIALGPVGNFPENNTRLATFKNPFVQSWDGQTGDIPCWVRRIEGEKFQVFAINCTHLGCPVRWFQESRLFMCPCHGGVFYEDGSRASGPPPRGLFEYQYKVENGQLVIHGGHLPNLSEPA
jgi:menaquinol-cytochrome c reductase iron-sulfur subunit